MTLRDGMCCEHCLIGGTVFTMMGTARVYECELEQRNGDKDCLGGFFEPCDYYPGCFTSRSRWPSKLDCPSNFKYNRICKEEMRKSQNCLKEEREEKEKNIRERERLRSQVFELLKRAEKLK